MDNVTAILFLLWLGADHNARNEVRAPPLPSVPGHPLGVSGRNCREGGGEGEQQQIEKKIKKIVDYIYFLTIFIFIF